MMTGRDPFETGVIAQGGHTAPGSDVVMLAEELQRQGYFTAAADNLGRWFTRGFSLYEVYQWEIKPGEPMRKAEGVNKSALKALHRCADQDQPFFLFLHYWDGHTPYLPPPPFDRMFYKGDEKDPDNPSMDALWDFEPFNRYFAGWMPGVTDIQFPIAQYDASLAYLDSCLQHLFNRMEQLGLLENTSVVITADHGEETDEHECWFDHHGLYDTNLRVPLLVRTPGGSPQRIPGFVRTLDIAPTILDLSGASPFAAPLQGASFRPMLEGAWPAGQGTCDELFLTECTWMRKRGYRSGRYKYIQALEPDIHGKPPEELYDLEHDPGEKHNLAFELPSVAADLKRRLMAWKTDREAASGRADPVETQRISLKRIGDPKTPVIRRGSVS